MLSDNDIRRIVARIVTGVDPVAVGIFGSYAVGRAHEGSDLDLFVIQHTVLSSSSRWRNIARHIHGVLHPLDIHVFTPEEFESEVLDELSFAWVIVRQARLYYQSSDMLAKTPSLRTDRRESGVYVVDTINTGVMPAKVNVVQPASNS